MKQGNVFGSDSKQYNALSMPLWIEVKEKKLGGGTFSLADYAKGDLIPAAIPVYLPKMGGTAVILDAFEVDGAVSATDTAVKLKDGIFGTKPKKDMVIGKVASTGIAAKAAALGTFVEGTGFTITANALGVLSDGDFVYLVAEAGSSKPAVKPTGLTLREINVDATVDVAHSIIPTATVAVVTKGQILADRMAAALPDWMVDALHGNITFEKEL